MMKCLQKGKVNVRDSCIVCGASLMLPPLFKCVDMPATAQILPSWDELTKDSPVDYELCQCSGCGLIQFNCDPVSYYRDSTRAGERSTALIELRREQYKHLVETYHLQGKKILEVGAGKGGFLKTLQEMTEYEVHGYGIENNADFVKKAKELYGVELQQGFLGDPQYKITNAPFDAFMSFAYPARLIDPNAMLRCVYNNLTPAGVGFIMVPSWEHLCVPGGFYDITSDHIAYYSKSTLNFLLEKNGFEVLENGTAVGTYVYAIVEKKQRQDMKSIWSDVEPIADSVRVFVEKCTKDNKKIAAWCAGHYAFTVISVAGVGNRISYLIDNAKFKQGRYTPASHVPIVGPEHFALNPVDTILILGPIYVQEIVREIREKCSPNVAIAVMNREGIRLIDA